MSNIRGGAPGRVAVRKTFKLFIGGKFPRSESGRSYEVTDSKGRFLANAAMASRKDARDAVVAARKAFPGWSAATAYNRGQVLYRVAELLEGRRGQFVEEVAAGEGLSKSKAEAAVDAAVDRWVWYAGW
jgi:acyl-CoA reductase-like NAD-dependent aldehyde dehydrogenase